MPLSLKQKTYYKALVSGKYRYMLYGGAVGGGKSFLTIGLMHMFASRFPNTRWGIFRKNLSVIKKTSIPTFRKIIRLEDDNSRAIQTLQHSDFINENRSDNVVYYKNGSQLIFSGADVTKDPELLDLSGLELTGAVMEEANQMPEKVFTILKTRVGRWENAKYQIPPIILLTCNPDKGWVKETFYDPWSEGEMKKHYYYLPALPSDNPHNTPEYLESLDDLPDSERARLRDGNWDFSSDKYQLVHFVWMKDLFHDTDIDTMLAERSNRFKVSLGVDVAGGGADSTVFAFFVGDTLTHFEEHHTDDKVVIAEMIADRMQRYEISGENVGVDSVGEGSGVANIVNRITGKTIIQYKGSHKVESRPSSHAHYKNKRTESHWNFRNDVREGNLFLPNHKQLIKEATNLKWFVKEEYYQIEKKEDFKARIGCSPDYLDAAVIGNDVRKNERTIEISLPKLKPLSSGILKANI